MKKIIRSSSAARFMACNAWLNFSDLPDETSSSAEEGTAFHELVGLIRDGKPVPVSASNGVVFTSEMKYYADLCLPLIPAHATTEQEISFDLNEFYKVVGHYDYCWEGENNSLHIMDIKYGFGIVEVEKNWQLISYAIGELFKRKKSYASIVLTIVQPRPYHRNGFVRTMTYTMQDLEQFYGEMVAKSNAVHQFKTSEQCKYCPANKHGKCTALNKAFYNAVDVVMEGTVSDDISNDKLGEMMEVYERIKDILKIKYDSIEALIKSRIQAGEVIKGYSIEPSYGNRKWNDKLTPEVFKQMTGVSLEKSVLKSPADIEKENKDLKEFIKSFTYVENKGFKVTKLDSSQMADKIFNNK